MDVRLDALKKANASLTYLVSVDMDALAGQLDARLIDGLKSGVAQKFEYTFELCWKCIKDFFKETLTYSSPRRKPGSSSLTLLDSGLRRNDGLGILQNFLKQQEGIDEATPKKIVKSFHLAGYVVEDDYLLLLKAIDDRNLLSHNYDEANFAKILSRIPGYARLIERVIPVIDSESKHA